MTEPAARVRSLDNQPGLHSCFMATLFPIRMEAKRRALDEIAAKQREVDRKRKEEADRQEAERQKAGVQQDGQRTEAVQ